MDGSSTYRIPTRAVLSPQNVTDWEKSDAYQDILGFLMSLNNSVRGKGNSSPCEVSPLVERLVGMLDTMWGWVEQCPPIDQPQRYGNKAFRQYYEKLKEQSNSLVEEVLGEEHKAAAVEVSCYLTESIGNSTRIDYGTGHELAFVMFLTCLFKVGALKQGDCVATVNKVFKRYIELVRELQTVYKMEPAGSQGVWSLDDYQFVPFIWGSAQLMMNPKIAPEMFTSPKTVEDNAEEYMFLACIQFILKVKTGPFAEHSNQLWNISAVKTWSKINQGLIKMYKAEVLNKFPVIQHVLFGSLLSFTPAPPKPVPSATLLPAAGPRFAQPPPVSANFTTTKMPTESVKSVPDLNPAT